MSDLIPLTTLNEEPRVDSRQVATRLGVQHESILSQLSDYEEEFKEFGLFRFETGEIQGRGRPPKFALLNEDQAIYLLTMAKNTEQARALKKSLVKAFRVARDELARQKPVLKTPAEMLLESVQQLVQHEQQLSQHDKRIGALEDWKKDAPLTSAQVKEIHALGQRLGKSIGYAKAWRHFKDRFNLASYRDLPAARFEEGRHFLQMQIKSYEPPEANP